MLVMAMALLGTMVACAWNARGWNYTENTSLGYMTQGGVIARSNIVLNWRNSDYTASQQSYYVTVPPNSVMDVEVQCSANSGILYTQVVPNTLGFTRATSLPVGWTRIGSVYSGSYATDFQVHMHFEASYTCYTYANLRLVCRKNGQNSTSPSISAGKKVTFNANGGTGGTSRNVSSGKSIGTLPKPTKKGYRFIGWFTKKSGGVKITAKTKVKKNVTYYAHWKANTYKIKFNANGGSGSMATLSATYGKTVTLKANAFKKSGRKFRGWSRTKGGAVLYGNKAKVKNLTTGNGKTVTLYAVWNTTDSSSSSTSGQSSTGSGTGNTYTSGSSTSSNAALKAFWMSEYRKWKAKADEQYKTAKDYEARRDRAIARGDSYATLTLLVKSGWDLYNTYVKNANDAYRKAMMY